MHEYNLQDKIGFIDGVIILIITYIIILISLLALNLLGTRQQAKRIVAVVVVALLLAMVIFIVVNLNTNLLDNAVNWLVNTAVWRWASDTIIGIIVFSIIFGVAGRVRFKNPWEW